ncbi:predicted protein [Nematostella vectensis]|uniref:Uncharacterized protein n=1 Tax=Nematostella vectensis TaxID=45351 RepID=A7RXM2_NEMVE|nr:predicted protein [Nematostella vectensis]|eukprot:XP_001635863.1 predicted protein [Nematostella vectensis]
MTMWRRYSIVVLIVLDLLLCIGTAQQIKSKKGCIRKETSEFKDGGVETQDLIDPDENGVYHTNTINDITLLGKKSRVSKHKAIECEDKEDSSSGDDEGENTPENMLLKATQQEPSNGSRNNENTKTTERKSDVSDSLGDEKLKIKDLQSSIHRNLVKLFHHLRHSASGRAKDEENKEVMKEKQDIVAEEKQIADLHQVSSSFLKGLEHEGDVSKLLHNNPKLGHLLIVNEGSGEEERKNASQAARKDSKADNQQRKVVHPNGTIQIHTNTEDEIAKSDKNNSSRFDIKLKAFLDAKRLSNGNLTALHKMVNKMLKHQNTTKLGAHTLPKPSPHKPFVVSKHDPYAEIAASPDHPKLPPHIKVPKSSSLIPVGLPNEDDADDTGPPEPPAVPNDKKEDHASPEFPAVGGGAMDGAGPMIRLPPPMAGVDGASEAPGQNDGTMAGMVNPDLTNQKAFDEMRAEAVQDQLQEQLQRQAMEGMGMGGRGMRGGGMPNMDGFEGMVGGMNGIAGMNGMGGGANGMVGGMNGMGGGMDDMAGGMGGGMNGMGAGMNAMGGGLNGIGGMNGMRGIGGMNGMDGMRGYERGPYGGSESFGLDRDEYPGQDDAYRRNPYEDQSPFSMGGYGASPSVRTPEHERDDDEDLDDGYGAEYDRKTKIAKVHDSGTTTNVTKNAT